MKKPTDPEICENCAFYNDFGRNSDRLTPDGDCRRNPPIRREVEGMTYGFFPEVDRFTWCGEWKLATGPDGT
jgi:hypothetical protein